MLIIPTEIIDHILSYLSLSDVALCLSTSKIFHIEGNKKIKTIKEAKKYLPNPEEGSLYAISIGNLELFKIFLYKIDDELTRSELIIHYVYEAIINEYLYIVDQLLIMGPDAWVVKFIDRDEKEDFISAQMYFAKIGDFYDTAIKACCLIKNIQLIKKIYGNYVKSQNTCFINPNLQSDIEFYLYTSYQSADNDIIKFFLEKKMSIN